MRPDDHAAASMPSPKAHPQGEPVDDEHATRTESSAAERHPGQQEEKHDRRHQLSIPGEGRASSAEENARVGFLPTDPRPPPL